VPSYELVYQKEAFNPVKEIIEVVQTFTDFYPTASQAEAFSNSESGIQRRLERASSENIADLNGFKSAVQAYNSQVIRLRTEGLLSENMKTKHNLPFGLVERIMIQSYDRAVSPKVDLLKKYENGSDNVYGELKNGFVYNILAETQLTSSQVFVDLGSGVANIVLQAALQVGCESWGCEIMPDACNIAEDYKSEFEARCHLWGIMPGTINLERGDFMINNNIRNALRQADVVLVNNRVFTPQLNNDLVNLFLDCKEGCKIVSLRSFVPANYKITSYNFNSVVNLLEVEQKSYPARSVSWAHEGDKYYVSTKNSKRLEEYSHLLE
jgi:H3 lysine-79-specific histone-lysine N-methyltransferase